MKIELLKDIMLPANGTKDKPNVGEPVIAEVGDVVEVADSIGKDWVERGLAKKSDAAVTIDKADDGEGGEKHVLTAKPAERKKKVVIGAPETKPEAGTTETK
jgi:hypothetical protein